MWKIGFFVTVFLWRSFHVECLRDSFLDLNLYFALVYLLHYYFSKNVFEKNFLRERFFFWTFDNLVTFSIFLSKLSLTLFFIYRHDYSFGSGEKWLSSERFFLFSTKRAQSKNKQLLCKIFPKINVLVKLFLISTFNPQEALNYLLNPTKLQKLEDWKENQNQVFNFTKTQKKTK